MAMQALIQIASNRDLNEEIDLVDEPNDLISSLRFQLKRLSWERAVALEARLVADALIKELDSKDKP